MESEDYCRGKAEGWMEAANYMESFDKHPLRHIPMYLSGAAAMRSESIRWERMAVELKEKTQNGTTGS